jgi:isocitrate/isopropylmalate dehydrogenase
MKLGDGLFLNTFRRVAEEYKSSGVEFNDMIVDNTYVAELLLSPDNHYVHFPALCN